MACGLREAASYPTGRHLSDHEVGSAGADVRDLQQQVCAAASSGIGNRVRFDMIVRSKRSVPSVPLGT